MVEKNGRGMNPYAPFPSAPYLVVPSALSRGGAPNPQNWGRGAANTANLRDGLHDALGFAGGVLRPGERGGAHGPGGLVGWVGWVGGWVRIGWVGGGGGGDYFFRPLFFLFCSFFGGNVRLVGFGSQKEAKPTIFENPYFEKRESNEFIFHFQLTIWISDEVMQPDEPLDMSEVQCKSHFVQDRQLLLQVHSHFKPATQKST